MWSLAAVCNHSSQSQGTQTLQWTNQNSKQLHVDDVKSAGKRAQTSHGFEFTSDWMKKWREFFSQSCVVVLHTNYSSIRKWKPLCISNYDRTFKNDVPCEKTVMIPSWACFFYCTISQWLKSPGSVHDKNNFNWVKNTEGLLTLVVSTCRWQIFFHSKERQSLIKISMLL